MKEILLCASAFSISMMISDAHLFPESIPTIDKQNYSLMEGELLYGNDYSIETDSGQVRAAAECFFGGYYPSGPSTGL
ncbi:MAG: hypothetical protein VX363_00450 [Pseudomonadota bacterium]